MPRLLLVLALLGYATVARAEDASVVAAKSVFAAQLKALNANDPKAFAKTFLDNGFVILPSAAHEGNGAAGIESAARAWLALTHGSGAKVVFTLDQAQYGKAQLGAWYYGSITMKIGTVAKTLRATGVVTTNSARALHLSEAIDDALVSKLAVAGKLPALKFPGTVDDEEINEELAIEKLGTTDWDAKNFGVVIGSAPKEIAFGTGAAAFVKAWKGLKIATTNGLRLHDSDDNGTYAHDVIIAHVTIAYGKLKVPFRVLTFSTPGVAGNDKSRLLIAHFSVASY